MVRGLWVNDGVGWASDYSRLKGGMDAKQFLQDGVLNGTAVHGARLISLEFKEERT